MGPAQGGGCTQCCLSPVTPGDPPGAKSGRSTPQTRAFSYKLPLALGASPWLGQEDGCVGTRPCVTVDVGGVRVGGADSPCAQV